MPQNQTLLLPAEKENIDTQQGSLFFIGTATVLLCYAGFTILTDPNFLHRGDHAHLGYGLQTTRLTDPAIEMEQLPAVDFVLLSHLHEDHFDRLVEQKLAREIPIVTTSHAATSLKKKGFTATIALNIWDELLITKGPVQLRLTSMPAKHAPGIMSFLLPPVMGSMLAFSTRNNEHLFQIYITGDTIVFERLKEIARRYSAIDLALFHLGGTRVVGMTVTMNGKQGVEALKMIDPQKVIPIHYNDYSAFKSPLSEFAQMIEDAGLTDKVHYLQHGETYFFNPSSY